MITLRPLHLPADYPRLAELFSSANPEPATADELAEIDSKLTEPGPLEHDEQGRLISTCRDRFAAVDSADTIVGYGVARRSLWTAPGVMYITNLVDPACQGQGVGTQILKAVEELCRQKSASIIKSTVRDHLPKALAFVQKRGYEVERHIFDSKLELSRFDPAPFTGVVEQVKAGGIRFFTLADAPGEATERALWELSSSTARDIPGYEGSPMPFEEWRKWTIETPDARPQWIFFAADGDRIAGMTTLMLQRSNGTLFTDYTGVYPEYRGRQLALALKLISIEAAREFGTPYMRTNNDSLNAPMLAVNRKLGYEPLSGFYVVKKALHTDSTSAR